MYKTFYREINLNEDSLEGKDIIAAQPRKEKGRTLIKLINDNPGLMWMCSEKVDIDTIRVCCEEIIARGEKGSVQLKLAKEILKLIKKPRSYTRKVTRKKMGRVPLNRRR